MPARLAAGSKHAHCAYSSEPIMLGTFGIGSDTAAWPAPSVNTDADNQSAKYCWHDGMPNAPRSSGYGALLSQPSARNASAAVGPLSSWNAIVCPSCGTPPTVVTGASPLLPTQPWPCLLTRAPSMLISVRSAPVVRVPVAGGEPVQPFANTRGPTSRRQLPVPEPTKSAPVTVMSITRLSVPS